MQAKIQALVGHRLFEHFIIAVIVLNSAVLGIETVSAWAERYAVWIEWVHNGVLFIFIVEVLLKWIAVAPRIQDYFKSGWNVFDFSIVVMSLVPAAGPYAMIARMGRLLRVVRLISALPQLRVIVQTLMHSLPGMGHIVMLMSVVFYVYAIVGFHLFGEHDPEHWRNLGIAMLTLFRIVTLEDWTDVMYIGMELSPYAWVYFVSFVVLGTFIVVNLFLAVVVSNMDRLQQERRQSGKRYETLEKMHPELAQVRDEINAEIRELKELLAGQRPPSRGD
ncbi:MAG: ion transporter [Pseudomonadota bacterium]